MELIKTYFSQQPKSKPKAKKPVLPLLVIFDYCVRYRPHFDKRAFEEQMEHTEGELISYFPNSITQQYSSFQSITKYMTIGFWVVCLGFAGTCHRIRLLNRLLGEKSWKMFSFKLLSVIVPFFVMQQVMPAAGQQQTKLLYDQIKNKFKRYKYSGDILQLNNSLILTGEGLRAQSLQQQGSQAVVNPK